MDLVVTSPPCNIAVKFGNKWKDRKIVESKGTKYENNLPEDEDRNLLKTVIQDCKRVLKDDGQFWFNRFLCGRIPRSSATVVRK